MPYAVKRRIRSAAPLQGHYTKQIVIYSYFYYSINTELARQPMLGVHEDASNDEVMRKIDVQTSELINAMQVSQQGTISTLTDTSAAIQIGGKLNEFDSFPTG